MNLKNSGDSTGFEPMTSAMPVQCTALHITFLSHDIPFTGKHEPNKLTCSQLCDLVAQLVRALHLHRRGHGFEPVESPEFFRFMRQLLKLSSKCEVISSLDFKHRTSYHISFIRTLELFCAKSARKNTKNWRNKTMQKIANLARM